MHVRIGEVVGERHRRLRWPPPSSYRRSKLLVKQPRSDRTKATRACIGACGGVLARLSQLPALVREKRPGEPRAPLGSISTRRISFYYPNTPTVSQRELSAPGRRPPRADDEKVHRIAMRERKTLPCDALISSPLPPHTAPQQSITPACLTQ